MAVLCESSVQAPAEACRLSRPAPPAGRCGACTGFVSSRGCATGGCKEDAGDGREGRLGGLGHMRRKHTRLLLWQGQTTHMTETKTERSKGARGEQAGGTR